MNDGEFPEPYSPTPVSSISEEGFWPSFTDVMMVVVIVFLLASMVVVVHNWELVDQVRVALLQEQEARKEAEVLSQDQQKTTAELARLHQQLHLTQREFLDTRTRLQGSLADLRMSTQELDQTRRDLSEAQLRGQAMEERIAELLAQGEIDENRILQVQEHHRQTREEFEALQEEYRRVESQYKALVRPARSDLGKIVVTVRYSREGADFVIMYRAPGVDGFESVTQEEMHRRLRDLKASLGDRLFVRIIFPEDSGLTYQEGWEFSLDLLTQYDYYYQ